MEETKAAEIANPGIGRGADSTDGEGHDDVLLPPRVVIGPDENGIKTTTEYRLDEGGSKVKVTTTTRVRALGFARFTKAAMERRGWEKFGDAASADRRSTSTVVSPEEVFLRPRSASALGPVTGDGLYVPPKRNAAVYTAGQGGNQGSLRVSNLPVETTEEDIRELFKMFGKIRSVSVAAHHKSGLGKGYAMVNFHSRF